MLELGSDFSESPLLIGSEVFPCRQFKGKIVPTSIASIRSFRLAYPTRRRVHRKYVAVQLSRVALADPYCHS